MSINTINTASIARFGHNVQDLDAHAALWLAEELASVHGNGWSVWKRISNLRANSGRGTTFPAFGSVCFQ